MQTTITTHRFEPDTVCGDKFQVVYTYTSHDKAEIDELEDRIKKLTGGAYMTVINSEDDLK